MVVGTASRDRWLSSSFCSEHISACQALWQKEGCLPPPRPSARREGSQEHEGSREGGAWAGRGGEDDVVLVSIRGFREPRKQL